MGKREEKVKRDLEQVTAKRKEAENNLSKTEDEIKRNNEAMARNKEEADAKNKGIDALADQRKNLMNQLNALNGKDNEDAQAKKAQLTKEIADIDKQSDEKLKEFKASLDHGVALFSKSLELPDQQNKQKEEVEYLRGREESDHKALARIKQMKKWNRRDYDNALADLSAGRPASIDSKEDVQLRLENEAWLPA